MKTKILAIALFLLVSIGVSANSKTEVNANSRALELIERVHQIRTMDFKEMSSEDKGEIKGELREIKSELRAIESTKGLDDKVSISIGAIIIIILLLIIL